jgi:hypothetical protein
MDIANKFKIIANHHSILVARYHSLGTTIGQLTAKGCINAKEHWKDGKYLYLLYAMKNGQRKKKYVGNHPLRVKEAQEKLQNYKDRLPLIRTRERLEAEISEIENVTNRLLHLCSKSDLSALFSITEDNNGDKTFSSRSGSSQSLYPKIVNQFGYKSGRRPRTICTQTSTDEIGYKNNCLQTTRCTQISTGQGI